MLELVKFPKHKIYLSRRNLLTLLSKLDRVSEGDESNCSLIKYKQQSPEYQQTLDSVMIIAVDDAEYYEAQSREAGEVHPADEEKIKSGICVLE